MRRAATARFLAGVGVSGFGDWLTTFALAVVLYRATGSYAATAGYFLVRVGPRPLGSWLGGPLGDLISPRLALLGAAITQGALTAALVVPLSAGHSIWAIYVLAGLSQLVGGAWQPLTAALMARVATGPRRHTINLVYILLGGLSMVVSPAIGALLLPPLGAVPLVLADACTFVLAAGLFVSLPPVRGGAVRRLTLRGAVLGGFTAIFRRRILRVIALGAFASTVAITALQTALPALAQQRFGNSADAGILYASVGLGSMGGSLLALWPRLRHPTVILPGIAMEIAGIGGTALAGAPSADLLILLASTAAASLAQVEGGVVVQSEPAGTVGRAQGAVSTCRFAGMATGALIALLLALSDPNSWQPVVAVLSVAALAILLASVIGPAGRTAPEVGPLSPLSELAD